MGWWVDDGSEGVVMAVVIVALLVVVISLGRQYYGITSNSEVEINSNSKVEMNSNSPSMMPRVWFNATTKQPTVAEIRRDADSVCGWASRVMPTSTTRETRSSMIKMS